MKRASFLTILIALMAMFFAACGDDSSSGNNPTSTDPSGEDSEKNGSVTAFFPSDFANKKVEAWYMYKETQKDGTQRVTAIFCFSDGTGVATMYKLKSDGTEFKKNEGEFEYTLDSGDYTTGKVSVIMGGSKMAVDINDGVMTSNFLENEMTKQDNSKVPAASKPTENSDDNGGHSGDNGGPSGDEGSVENEDVEGFLPTEYAKKTVAAWYIAEAERSADQVKIMAVFLFDDNSLVVTKHKVRSDGREYREIEFSGSWEMLEGNFEDGKASISGGMEITIVDGAMDVQGEHFVKQDNSKVPEASDVMTEEKS